MKPPTPLPNVIDEDWRLQTSTQLTKDWADASGQLVPKGSRVVVSAKIQLKKKKQLIIPIPNATALLLNSSSKAFSTARDIRESSGIDKLNQKNLIFFSSDKDAFDFIENMIGAIVLAFTALEAFVNETIPEDFIYVCDVKGEKEKKFDKTSIERYIPIDEKLATILPKILNCKSPKTFHCWGNYKKLKTTRDRLIHMKTEDRNYSSSKQDTVWKAVLIYPAPHQAAKAIIDHYANAMQTKPNWHLKFPIL